MTPSSRSQRWRRVSTALIGLLISAGFLYLLASGIDLSQVLAEISKVRAGLLSLCLGSTLLGFLAMTGRSAVLLRPLHRYPPVRVFKSVLVGFAGNNVLPLRMGELLRIDYLARHGGCPHTSCLAVLAVERLLDLTCLLVLLFAVLSAAVVEIPVRPALGLGVVVVAALFGLFAIGRDRSRLVNLSRRLTGWMGERISGWLAAKAAVFAEGLSSSRSPASVAAAFGLSWAYWLAAFLSIRIVLWALDLALPWYAPAVVVVLVAFGAALPSAPAFVGTYHYFAALALTLLNVEPARAASFAIVLHAVGTVPYTVISLLLLSEEILRREPAQRAENDW